MFQRNLGLGDIICERQGEGEVTDKSKVSELGVVGKS